MQEIWKSIPGYEGIYQISNLGHVKSLERDIIHKGNITHLKERIMKPFVNNGGYYCIKLSKLQKYKNCKVHRLVADAFIPNPHNYECVNHKDENKKNNNVSNLEWCTKQYNNTYGTKISKHEKEVLQYDLQGNFIQKFKSVNEASRVTGFSPGNIVNSCNQKQNHANGYIWCYFNSELKDHLKRIHDYKPIGVLQFSINGDFIKEFPSISIACLETGCHKSNIHKCCKGISKSNNGFIWKYADK